MLWVIFEAPRQGVGGLMNTHNLGSWTIKKIRLVEKVL